MNTRTITELYDYTNSLLGNELSDFSDIAAHVDEAQNLIAIRFHIIAPATDIEVENNVFTMPTDCLRVVKIEIKSTKLELKIENVWDRTVTVGSYAVNFDPLNLRAITEVNETCTIYYHKKPLPVPINDSAIQEGDVLSVDDVYFHAIGKYAAAMYLVGDDDREKASDYKSEFLESVAVMCMADQSNRPSTFKNAR